MAVSRWQVWRYSGEGLVWCAYGEVDGKTYADLFRSWREAYAFAYVATHGTRTAFDLAVDHVRALGGLPDYYLYGFGEEYVPRRCPVCAPH